jgi:tetratricopeptide (TPR) repeat protein
MQTTGRTRIYILTASLVCLFLIFGGCSSKEQKRDKHLAKAKEYIAKSEYNKAVIELKNVIQLDPNNESAYVELGEAYLKLKQGTEAYQAFLRASSINPDDINVQLKVGQMLLLAKETKQAREKAELILKKNPNGIEGLSLLSGVQLQEKDINSAIATLEKIAAIDPKQFNTQLSLGRVYALKGDLDKSEGAFIKAKSLDPKSNVPYIALSQIYGSKNEWDKAEATLKEMLNSSDSKYQDLYYLAVFYEARSRWDDAEKTYNEAVATSPKDDVSPLINLGQYYARRKNYNQALEAFNKASDIKKNDLNITLTIAQLNFDFEKIKEAEALVDKVLEKNKGDISASFLKGRILMYKKDYKNALERFDAVIKDKADNYLAHYMKALCLLAQNNTSQGRGSLVKAVELNPSFLEARLLLAELYIRSGDKALAKEQVEAILARAPENTSALLMKGNLRILEKDSKGAEEAFQKVVSLSPNNPAGYLRLGVLYNLMGKKEDALKNLQKSLDLNPLQTDALGLIMSIYIKDKKYSDAMSSCERQKAKAKESKATLAVIEYLEGSIYVEQKDMAKAKEHYNQAIEIDPNVLSPYVALAGIYAAEKNFNGAITQYKAIIEKNPKYVSGYMALGAIYDQMGDSKNAETNYRKALDLNPKFGPAANNLAWKLATGGGSVDEALNLAQVAKEQLPKSASVMDTLGWIYYLKGSYLSAISELQDSLQLSPDNAEVNYHLGMAYYKSSQNANAKEYLKKALGIKTDFSGVDEARRVLNELADK